MRVRDVSESWGEAGPPSSSSEEAPFLPRVLLGLRRRGALLLLVWAATVGLAGLAVGLRPAQYRAEAMLEIRPEQPLIADPADPTTAANVQLWDSYFRTQVSLLQSRKLLDRALRAVPSPAVPEQGAKDPLDALASQLEVEAVPSTFILRVALTNPSPDRGPELLNALVQSYLEEATGHWRELKTDAVQLLDRETLPSIRNAMEEADRKLHHFQEDTGYADFDEQFASQSESARKLTARLLEVRLRRVGFLSHREALSGGGRSALAGLFDPAIQNTHSLEPLLSQKATLEAQLATESLIYKEKHPRIVAIRRQLSQVDVQIQALVQAAAQAIDRELLSVQVEERLLVQDLEAVEKEMADSRLQRSRYRTLQSEAAAAKEVYTAYVKKSEESKATSKGGLASVRVIDLARSPALPSGKGRLILTVGAVLGLLFGVAAALGAEEFDDRITSPRDVEISLGVSVIGLIPRLHSDPKTPARAPLVLTDDPGSLTFEVLRMLRAEVSARLERVRRGKVIAVASPRYGEGKSTIAINLARVLAMEDRRVLLIDGDLRRPQLKGLLARRKGMGLEEYLREEQPLHGCVQPSRLPLVDVIGAEQPLARPGEVAGAERFRALLHEARKLYEYVILDAGAANLISEVSAYARQADGTVLVLEYGETRRRSVRLSKRRLEGARILGAVLNGVPAKTTVLELPEPDLSPDLREELDAGDELVAIVEQDPAAPDSPDPGPPGSRSGA
ncbi:MAG TPA: AAA family ATPase [Planctomycetota bacterium]|nr:AAA family ATPase [Planctomycetota bacterium]